MPRPGRRAGYDSAGFLLPFGRRHSLHGHPVPPRGFRPSCDRPTAPPEAARTRAGFPCSARVRHGRSRAPSIPRGQRCLHGHVCVPYPPPAALQRPVPVTPVHDPSRSVSLTRHQQGFTGVRPSRPFPSPVAPGRNGNPRAFPRASHPTEQDPAAHARVGTGLRHWPGITPSPSATSFSAFTHYERLHVATHLRGVLSAWAMGA
jgi:hypothetical protein